MPRSPLNETPVDVTALLAPRGISRKLVGSPTWKSRSALAVEFTTTPISELETVPSINASSLTDMDTDADPALPSESVAVSVKVWRPIDGAETSIDAPVPISPSIELFQTS